MAIKSIKVNNLAFRAILLAAMLVCLAACTFFVRWCIGNAVAQNTIQQEVAEWAISMAPHDPQTHYTAAVLLERTFQADNLVKSLAEYEQTTALAPQDYRTWMALGSAREHNGDAAGAERALRKALELAPNYSEVKWILGNVLLRQGKQEEAFVQLRSAAAIDSRYTNPTVATAWQLFDGDMRQVSRLLGDSPVIRAVFVGFLIREKRIDEAVAVWDSLPAEERKTTFKETGTQLYGQLKTQGNYREALQILGQIGEEEIIVGKIFNGGFEGDVKARDAGDFDWRIQDGVQPQISIDNSQKHGGERSLVAVFNSATGYEFRTVAQTIVVEPGKKYSLDMFYKSELKTTATLYWQVKTVSGEILAATGAVAAVAGWTALKVDFTVPAKTEAIIITPARETCKSSLCPISGRIWFDDISLVP